MTTGNVIYLVIVATLLSSVIFTVWKLAPGH